MTQERNRFDPLAVQNPYHSDDDEGTRIPMAEELFPDDEEPTDEDYEELDFDADYGGNPYDYDDSVPEDLEDDDL